MTNWIHVIRMTGAPVMREQHGFIFNIWHECNTSHLPRIYHTTGAHAIFPSQFLTIRFYGAAVIIF